MRLRGGSHTGQAGGSSRLIRPVTEAPRRGDPRRNGPSPVPFDRTRLRENTSRESSKSGCRLRGRRQPGERGGVGSNADPVAFWWSAHRVLSDRHSAKRTKRQRTQPKLAENWNAISITNRISHSQDAEGRATNRKSRQINAMPPSLRQDREWLMAFQRESSRL